MPLRIFYSSKNHILTRSSIKNMLKSIDDVYSLEHNSIIDRENGMSIRDNGSLTTNRSAADHNAAGRDRVIMDDRRHPSLRLPASKPDMQGDDRVMRNRQVDPDERAQ